MNTRRLSPTPLLALSLLACLGAHATALGDNFRDAIREATDRLRGARTKLSELEANPNASFGQQMGEALDHVDAAVGKLEAAAGREGSGDASSQAKANLREAQTSITQSRTLLASARAMAYQTKTKNKLSAVEAMLVEANELLSPFADSNTSPPGAAAPTDSHAPVKPEEEERLEEEKRLKEKERREREDGLGLLATISPYVLPATGVLAGGVVLALVAYLTFLLFGLRNLTEENFNGRLPKALVGLKGRQDELAAQMETFAGINKEISQRLSDLHGEVRQVSRTLQLAQPGAGESARHHWAVPASVEPPAGNDGGEPDFPISADELLRRMRRKSTVVKRDFQNDVLVADPEGRGELVLIRDAGIPDEIQSLFIVPRVTQLQMRQEYYNFYEKYYDCSNPESGALWIIDPAVVEKVSGGWQLREKGRLEVR